LSSGATPDQAENLGAMGLGPAFAIESFENQQTGFIDLALSGQLTGLLKQLLRLGDQLLTLIKQ
tara:strand:+ start:2115 stop:2306 length:192 start_codon:yes stop_codon:yes gene_type:complete